MKPQRKLTGKERDALLTKHSKKAFVSAAKRLRMDAVELAQCLEGAGIADLIIGCKLAQDYSKHWPFDESDGQARERKETELALKQALAKVESK